MFSSMRRHSLRLQHELLRWSVAGGGGGGGGDHQLPVSCMSQSKSCPISSAGESDDSRDSWSSSDSVYSVDSAGETETRRRGTGSPFRVVLLGASGVGKTLFASLFAGAADGMDTEDCETYGDAMCEKTIEVDGESATITLFDPEDESEWVQEQFMETGDAYLLLYSITDRASFLRASELRISLRRHRPAQHTPIILVGNKCDLVRRRQVSFNEGRVCAAVFDCKFVETSAAMEHNVWETFQGIVRQLRLRRDSKAANDRRKHTHSNARRDSLPKKAKRFLNKVMAKNNTSMAFRLKSKSCHNLSVL